MLGVAQGRGGCFHARNDRTAAWSLTTAAPAAGKRNFEPHLTRHSLLPIVIQCVVSIEWRLCFGIPKIDASGGSWPTPMRKFLGVEI